MYDRENQTFKREYYVRLLKIAVDLDQISSDFKDIRNHRDKRDMY
jgi:hypothetical protein